MNLNQVTAPALDMAASIAFYETLGLTLIVRTDHYARFECPDGDATFSLALRDTPLPRDRPANKRHRRPSDSLGPCRD